MHKRKTCTKAPAGGEGIQGPRRRGFWGHSPGWFGLNRPRSERVAHTLSVVVVILMASLILPHAALAQPGNLTLASTSDTGIKGNDLSSFGTLSADGTKVAFNSVATNLDPNDTDALSDVYVKDLVTGNITLASTSDSGIKANGDSAVGALSADGTKVVFQSAATNLDPADTDTIRDVYVKDLVTGNITLASTSDSSIKADGDNAVATLSADGTKVAFHSAATNLDPTDGDAAHDIYVKNLLTGDITLASTSDGGIKSNGESLFAFLSADGTKVAFGSLATNLDAADADATPDVYVKNLATGAITLASTSGTGTKGNGPSAVPALSADGMNVAFRSLATNLDVADADATPDVYVKNLATGAITLASTSGTGTKGNSNSDFPILSADGTRVTFQSAATNLDPADSDPTTDIYVKDLLTGAITLASTSDSGTKANDGNFFPWLSADGTRVVFESNATNLDPADSDPTADIYVKELAGGAAPLIDLKNHSWPTAYRLTLDPTPSDPSIKQATVDEHLFSQDQSAWFKFTVQPGSKVVVTLNNLPADYDLLLYKDIAAAYTTLTSAQDLLRLSAEIAPENFSPENFSPENFSPENFSPENFSPENFSSGETISPQAYSNAQTRSLLAISARSGTSSEIIIRNTWDNTGDFYVRVHGRNGAFNLAAPFRLNVRMLTGACGPIVPITTPPTARLITGVAGPNGGYRTIIVTDLPRTVGTAAEKADLQARLAVFAARSEVKGVVVDVGKDAAGVPRDDRIQAANAQADAHKDCPYAKNLVASEIKRIIDSYGAVNPLEYIVLVGSDGVIPFFRHPDQAGLANESNYVPPVLDSSASQASLRLGYVLSQDRYGARVEMSRLDHTDPIPSLAVGRIGETAAEATGLVDAYLATPDGTVPTPTSALVTGYDFLADSAEAIRPHLAAGLGQNATVDALIESGNLSPTDPAAWTADQLRSKLLDSRHDLIYLAGHFSQGSMLAADYTTRLTVADVVASAANLDNAIIFGTGCHAGYNTVDDDAMSYGTGDAMHYITEVPDWPQGFARKRATLIAGTGYQYGDTELVEYGERLYLEFAKQLRTGTGPVSIGKALVAAKKAYLCGTPLMRGIHEKTYLQATLYGLPHLKVNLPGERLGPQSAAPIVDQTTSAQGEPGATLGLRSADATVTPILSTQTLSLKDASKQPGDPGSLVTATYLSGSNGLVTNPDEPVLPLEIRNVSVSGQIVRGVGFRAGSYTDLPGVFPLTGAPETEIRSVHTPFMSDYFYPIQPWRMNYCDALANTGEGITNLVVTPAQFKSSSSGSTTGTLRQFNNMAFRVYYNTNLGAPALAGAPTIADVSALPSGTQLNFQMTVLGDPAAGVQETWVTYTAKNGPFAGKWQSLDLVRNPAEPTRWEGTLALAGTSPEDIRYMVQAVNGVGLVSLDTNLGAYYVPGPPPAPSPKQPTTLAVQSPPTSGRYGEEATFKAVLRDANGIPLAGQTVSFSLGSQRRQATTDSTGLALVTLPLVQVAGQYDLSASFAETTDFVGSSVQSTFSIKKQPTLLTFASAMFTVGGQYSDGMPVVATLSDGMGRNLQDQTVVFVVTGGGHSYATAVKTDFAGRAMLGQVPLPPGTYLATASFSGAIDLGSGQTLMLTNNRYLPSQATASLTIASLEPENATVQYAGQTAIPVGETLHLAAAVKQAADGQTGNIALAEVRYQVTNASGALVADLTVPSGVSGNWSTTLTGLDTGVYNIATTVVGEFFTSPTSGALVVVYNPSGGFVIGGGSINSPTGAYTPIPTLTGRINFGFVARSQRGATVPTGQTEFQFVDLNFHSTAYEWLVITGARAQYKGSGTINDAGNYGFILTAIDGDLPGGGGVDRLRIKIWDQVTGAIVYDNQMGAAETADPTTAIAGGSIIIHK